MAYRIFVVEVKYGRERQMPYDFTYMWNLKNNINKQNRNILIDTESRLKFANGERGWETG